MKPVRTFLILIAPAIITLALTPTVTQAENVLPTALLLAEETVTLTATGAFGSLSELHSTSTVTAEGYRFTLETKEAMTSLGPGTLWFLDSELRGKKCGTTGDLTGNVLVPVEWHTVLGLSGGSKLFLVLILVKAVTFECVEGAEKVKIVVNGSQLVDVEPFGTNTFTVTATVECSKTTPKFTEYDLDKEGMGTANLKAEVAGVKGNACLLVGGTTHGAETIFFNASDMIEVMEP